MTNIFKNLTKLLATAVLFCAVASPATAAPSSKIKLQDLAFVPVVSTDTLQAGTTFYVSSGAVTQELNILGQLKFSDGTLLTSTNVIAGYLLSSTNTWTAPNAFLQIVTADITGNAGTVTNGVYTNQSYSNPSWITYIAPDKLDYSTITLAIGIATTSVPGFIYASSPTISGQWSYSQAILANITGNAGTVTNGAYINIDNNWAQTQTFQYGILVETITANGDISADTLIGTTVTALGQFNFDAMYGTSAVLTGSFAANLATVSTFTVLGQSNFDTIYGSSATFLYTVTASSFNAVGTAYQVNGNTVIDGTGRFYPLDGVYFPDGSTLASTTTYTADLLASSSTWSAEQVFSSAAFTTICINGDCKTAWTASAGGNMYTNVGVVGEVAYYVADDSAAASGIMPSQILTSTNTTVARTNAQNTFSLLDTGGIVQEFKNTSDGAGASSAIQIKTDQAYTLYRTMGNNHSDYPSWTELEANGPLRIGTNNGSNSSLAFFTNSNFYDTPRLVIADNGAITAISSFTALGGIAPASVDLTTVTLAIADMAKTNVDNNFSQTQTIQYGIVFTTATSLSTGTFAAMAVTGAAEFQKPVNVSIVHISSTCAMGSGVISCTADCQDSSVTGYSAGSQYLHAFEGYQYTGTGYAPYYCKPAAGSHGISCSWEVGTKTGSAIVFASCSKLY